MTAVADLWQDLTQQLSGVVEGETDATANLANAAAIVFHGLADVNWAGFYLWRNDELVLGPFQGRPACVRIALGKGVCGAAAATRQTQRIADVHAFPGHIACDAASRSELVVPLLDGDRLLGVLDLDSPMRARFGAADGSGADAFVRVLVAAIRTSL